MAIEMSRFIFGSLLSRPIQSRFVNVVAFFKTLLRQMKSL